MKIKFYIDEHMPKTIVTQLHKRGIEAIHPTDTSMLGADDDAHLAFAIENGYAFVSRDRDLAKLNTEWLKSGKEHAGIIFVTNYRVGIGSVVKQLNAIYTTDTQESLRNSIRFIS